MWILSLLNSRIARYALAAVAVVAIFLSIYLKGRSDGVHACEIAQAKAVVTIERRAGRAREKARQSVPQTEDAGKILDWLGGYAVERY
ncbi:hypothetical protein JL101_035950 (plasmid) [Skermanella rosea]|uniref:hypothetical protein n=1 Tax=Skermanella rosea TaxID=1817965 RepID=UPI001931BBE5|nr:hypothetical protein [Skermanella rosea]UEM08047.1 hypothetical protein JL101_035950 [Skermanella rosea]